MVQPSEPYSRLKNHSSNLIIDISEDNQNSTSVDMQGNKLRAILMPSAMSASKFKIQFSMDNSTFYDIADEDGNTKEVDFTANSLVFTNDFDFLSMGYIRVKSDGTETADRQFTCIFG